MTSGGLRPARTTKSRAPLSETSLDCTEVDRTGARIECAGGCRNAETERSSEAWALPASIVVAAAIPAGFVGFAFAHEPCALPAKLIAKKDKTNAQKWVGFLKLTR